MVRMFAADVCAAMLRTPQTSLSAGPELSEIIRRPSPTPA